MTYAEMIKAMRDGISNISGTPKRDDEMWNTQPQTSNQVINNIQSIEPQNTEMAYEQTPPSKSNIFDFNIPNTNRRISEFEFMPTENYLSNVGQAAKSVYENTNIIPEYIKTGFQNLINKPQDTEYKFRDKDMAEVDFSQDMGVNQAIQPANTTIPSNIKAMQTGQMPSEPSPFAEGIKSWATNAIGGLGDIGKTIGYGLLGAGMGYGGATPGQITNTFMAGQENYNKNNPNSPLSRQMQRLIKGYATMYKDEIQGDPDMAELFSQDVTSLPASALIPYYSKLSTLHSQKLAEQKYNALYGAESTQGLKDILKANNRMIESDPEQNKLFDNSIDSITNPATLQRLYQNQNAQLLLSKKQGEKEIIRNQKLESAKLRASNVVSQNEEFLEPDQRMAIENLIKDTTDADVLEKTVKDFVDSAKKKREYSFKKEQGETKFAQAKDLKEIDLKNKKLFADYNAKIKSQLNKENAELKLQNSTAMQKEKNKPKYQNEIVIDNIEIEKIDKALNLFEDKLKGAKYEYGKGWVKDGRKVLDDINLVTDLEVVADPNSKKAEFNSLFRQIIANERHKIFGATLTGYEQADAQRQYYDTNLQTLGNRIKLLKQYKDYIIKKHDNYEKQIPSIKESRVYFQDEPAKPKKEYTPEELEKLKKSLPGFLPEKRAGI